MCVVVQLHYFWGKLNENFPPRRNFFAKYKSPFVQLGLRESSPCVYCWQSELCKLLMWRHHSWHWGLQCVQNAAKLLNGFLGECESSPSAHLRAPSLPFFRVHSKFRLYCMFLKLFLASFLSVWLTTYFPTPHWRPCGLPTTYFWPSPGLIRSSSVPLWCHNKLCSSHQMSLILWNNQAWLWAPIFSSPLIHI